MTKVPVRRAGEPIVPDLRVSRCDAEAGDAVLTAVRDDRGVDTGGRRQVALMVIKIWLDPEDDGSLRARITETPDVAENNWSVSVSPTRDEVLEQVQRWLADLS